MRAKLAVIAAILSLSASVISPVALASNFLRVSTGEYAPFTDSTVETGGSVNHFVSRMANDAGLKVEFEYMPWKRALELTRAGRFDATSFWYYSEDRHADFIHVGPILQDRLVFFRRADTAEPDWDGLEDLSGYKIGAVTGYTYTPEFWSLAEKQKIEVEVAPNDEANLRKLLAGRIDLFPMSEQSGRLLMERLFPADQQDQVGILSRPLVVTDGYLLISRSIENADALAARLQAAVDANESVMN